MVRIMVHVQDLDRGSVVGIVLRNQPPEIAFERWLEVRALAFYILGWR